MYFATRDFTSGNTWSFYIFKYIIMFVLISEMVPDSLKKAISINDSIERHRTDRRAMYWAFTCMYTMHIVFDFLIFLLANFFILLSPSLFDAINNSIGVLILNYLYTMGSKYFLLDLSGSLNDIYNDPDFLKLTSEKDDCQHFHFVFQRFAWANSLM